MTETTTTTLYDRLGRRDGITNITRELIKNHMANPLVRNRYEQITDMDRIERNVIDFFWRWNTVPLQADVNYYCGN